MPPAMGPFMPPIVPAVFPPFLVPFPVMLLFIIGFEDDGALMLNGSNFGPFDDVEVAWVEVPVLKASNKAWGVGAARLGAALLTPKASNSRGGGGAAS
jgi:hypothetical protein